MSTVARRQCARGTVFGAVLAGILSLLLVDCDPTTSASRIGTGTNTPAPLAGSTPSFAIEGNATEPISPGVRAPLDLALTNTQDLTMSVTDLRVTVQKVSAPNADNAHPCSVGDFTVGQTSRRVTIRVAARRTSPLSSLGVARAAWPRVGMLDRSANQDGCKGASLTLGYAATRTLTQ